MTSSGKIRIYELSKDLSLDNKDVLDAARKLAIAAKSHSSSISNLEANQIKNFLKESSPPQKEQKHSQKKGKEILSVKKNPVKIQKNISDTKKPSKVEKSQKAHSILPSSTRNLNVPSKPKQTLITSKEISSSHKSQQSTNKTPEKVITAPSQPNKPSPPKPRQEIKPSVPKQPNKVIVPQKINNQNKETNLQPIQTSSQTPKAPLLKPQLTSRPEPKRPLAPPSRPQINRPENKLPSKINQRSKPLTNQRRVPPQKSGSGNPQRSNNQNKQIPPNRAGQPPSKGNPLELVGAPI